MKRNFISKKGLQKQANFRIFALVGILICINVLGTQFHFGFDLTRESRFTLSRPTVNLLENLKEVAVIDVYLTGKKFPAHFQRIQEAVVERLRSFKEVAGNKIVYRFIDPLEGKTEKEQKLIVHELEQKGILYIQVASKDDEDYSMKICFPYALVQYGGREMPVLLLENPPNKTAEEKINYSDALLEYKFVHALNALKQPARPKVAYLTGNGEMLDINTFDMLFNTLPYYYDLDTIDIKHKVQISPAYDALIINQPTEAFTEEEKFKIDQYVMHKGHVLWVVNNIIASLDSFRSSPQFVAMDYHLNLDDILFKYGVRINSNLIEDKQCAPLPRTFNGQVDVKDWVYFPRLNPVSEHPIVRNLDFILAGFSSSIDTIKTTGIKKTVLLQSSKYSRTALAPVRVSLSMMNYPIPERLFDKPYQPVAVLLEGRFASCFENRLAPSFVKFLDSIRQPFVRVVDTNSMIVVSAGNVFRNEYSTKQGVLPIGYYPYSTEFFENKSFLLNCLEYLTDKSGILESRSKQVKLRLLDEGRVKAEKDFWETLNVGFPILLILLFSSVYIFVRRRKYEGADIIK